MGMATAIYCPQGSTQDQMTPEEHTRKGRIWKGKHSRRRKRQQPLQKTQQLNVRRKARQRPTKNKRNLTRQLIALRQNGYPTLISKEMKVKRAGKIKPIRQETQAVETAALDDKTCRKKEKKKSIAANENGKWCAQDKISNKQNSVVQEKDAYNDVISKYREGSY